MVICCRRLPKPGYFILYLYCTWSLSIMYDINFSDGYSPVNEQGEEIKPEIIDKVCRKVIKRIKKDLKSDFFGDYPYSFNAYDTISMAHCCFGYELEEINPYLEKYIYDIIDEYAEDTPIQCLNIFFNRFMEMLEQHSYLKKIQKVYERY